MEIYLPTQNDERLRHLEKNNRRINATLLVFLFFLTKEENDVDKGCKKYVANLKSKLKSFAYRSANLLFSETSNSRIRSMESTPKFAKRYSKSGH